MAEILYKSKDKEEYRMISYEKLLKKLEQRNITKSDLISLCGVSSRTIAKIGRGELIADYVLDKIAEFLECKRNDIYEIISDNKLLQILRDEKSMKLSGGIYHELQVRMTFNSNHIEGSSLSEEQTRLIFETHTFGADDGVPIDDIIETVNHFRAIDYVIDISEEVLSEDIIKHLHRIIKQSTIDSTKSWFAVGDYKKKANIVGGHDTASPENVEKEIKKLLSWYNCLKTVTINDVIEFHFRFERIHPFQDGNGRVGRLIALKECLKNSIVPFIIEDTKKIFYYRGLSEWENDKAYLIDTCLDGQDTFKALMKYFSIEE